MTPRRRRGLTIVEVLVVLACITILVGLVLPAVAGVSAMARSTRCQANLRQMGLGAIAYTSVYDAYPAAVLYHKRDAGIEIAAWDFVQSPGGDVTPGPLWSFTDGGDPRVQQCPDFTGSSTFGNDPYTGYNYNTSFVGAEGRFPQLDPNGNVLDGWSVARRGIPAASHRRPGQTALFGDAGWAGGANKFMRAPMNTVETDLGLVHAGGQAFRHRGCCNVAWMDGHVSCTDRVHRGALATDELLDEVMGFPENGFLSDDDAAYDPR